MADLPEAKDSGFRWEGQRCSHPYCSNPATVFVTMSVAANSGPQSSMPWCAEHNPLREQRPEINALDYWWKRAVKAEARVKELEAERAR